MNTLNQTSNLIDSASLLDYVTEAIVVADKDTRVLYANAAAYKMLGFAKKDLAQIKLFDLVHPDDKKKVKEYESELKHKTSMITYRRLKKKDGSYAVIEKSARMLADG